MFGSDVSIWMIEWVIIGGGVLLLIILLMLMLKPKKSTQRSAQSTTSSQKAPIKTVNETTVESKAVEPKVVVEPKVEEKPEVVEIKPETNENKVEEKKADAVVKEKPVKPAKYHISQNKDTDATHAGEWRVRKEGSTKTIKYFSTQKAAIEFAETLAENQDSSIVIHKKDGSIRKQDYKKK